MRRNNAISPEAVAEGASSVTDLLRRRVQLAGQLDSIVGQLGEVFNELRDLHREIAKEVTRNLGGDSFRAINNVEASGIAADRVSNLLQVRIAGIFNPFSVPSDHLSLKDIFEKESPGIAASATASRPPKETFLGALERLGYTIIKYEGP